MVNQHIERQIHPEAHSPMYNWHKFWARKPWNVVSEFVKNYSTEGGIILDPFCGSGVTAIEALRLGRRAIAIDINPMATEILRTTVQYINLDDLTRSFEHIAKKVRTKILSLYQTQCRKCKQSIPIICAIWKRDDLRREKMIEVRYRCQHCGNIQEKECNPRSLDKQYEIESRKMLDTGKYWYPQNQLSYPNGQPFKEKQKYDSIPDLFTKRNLLSLSYLIHAIEDETNPQTKDFLNLCFSSMLHLCSKMCPISEAGHFTAFSSSWIQHSYWYANTYMEQNVWLKFESAFHGNQSLIRAKAEANELFRDKKITSRLEDFAKGKGDLLLVTRSCLDTLREFNKADFQVDYCFTDPPYDSSIQYGELCYLWACWLRKDNGYLQTMLADEVIHNERQNKNFEQYHTMLSACFKEIYSILKPDNYLTITFHNPTFKVRNATIRAGLFAGFDFQKIHYQELARPSAKSLLQPFGSANGDFYLRFYKPPSGETVPEKKDLTEARFSKVVVETTKRLLAERWEPTPYTIIINHIDPVLAREGFYRELHPGFDVKTVLQNHLGDLFVLQEATIGGARGQLWWFKDPSVIKHHNIPLSERVENTVLRVLQSRYKTTFTELWDTVNTEYSNALMSDSTSIVETIEEYAAKQKGGYWILKATFKQRASEHTTLLMMLARLGRKFGYRTWIGLKEQGEKIRDIEEQKTLRIYCSDSHLKLREISQQALEAIQYIDVIWYTPRRIEWIFEVEHTTMMTLALERASHLPYQVNRIMLIPDEREKALQRKLRSPMFKERFVSDKWQILYYDSFKNNYDKLRKRTIELERLLNQKVTKKMTKGKKTLPLQLMLI